MLRGLFGDTLARGCAMLAGLAWPAEVRIAASGKGTTTLLQPHLRALAVLPGLVPAIHAAPFQ